MLVHELTGEILDNVADDDTFDNFLALLDVMDHLVAILDKYKTEGGNPENVITEIENIVVDISVRKE